MMKHVLLSLGLMAAMALPAQAGCYADYKAKRDNPLKLHYGVIELPDTACDSKQAAAQQISGRISGEGWTLLTVLGIFDASELNQRKDSAGAYFLRF